MDAIAQRIAQFSQSILLHESAHRFGARRYDGFPRRRLGQRIDITDFGGHDHDLLGRVADELHHALGRAELHHIRRSFALGHLAHAGAGATALRMHDHSGVGVEFALLLDMVGPNAVVDMTCAHHQPQPVDGLLLLLQ